MLFVCVKNGGKSQMAAALMRQHSGDRITVHSAGTQPGNTINAESASAIEEIGATMAGEHPKPINQDLLESVDRVIILGRDALIDTPGTAPIERWDTDEPSARGIQGPERMRLIREDIQRRVIVLSDQLTSTS